MPTTDFSNYGVQPTDEIRYANALSDFAMHPRLDEVALSPVVLVTMTTNGPVYGRAFRTNTEQLRAIVTFIVATLSNEQEMLATGRQSDVINMLLDKLHR